MTVGVSLPALRGSEKPSTITSRQHPEIGGRDDSIAKVKVEATPGTSASERGSEGEEARKRGGRGEEARGKRRGGDEEARGKRRGGDEEAMRRSKKPGHVPK